MTFSDGRSDGTYGVRVFAMNYAAAVWPNDVVHTEYFHREPDQPGLPRNIRVTSANDAADFSYDFDDAWSVQHYNVAETMRLGFDYANARRDPSETDPIPRVSVQPTSASLTGLSFYDFALDELIMTSDVVLEDHVLLHEYAHFLEEHLSSFAVIPSTHAGCETRRWSGGPLVNSEEHAWMEGFADYFARAVARSLPLGTLRGTRSTSSLEFPRPCDAVGKQVYVPHFPWSYSITDAMVEDTVAAVLWDLFDPTSDPRAGVEAHDTVAGEDTAIFQIFDRELDREGVWPTIFHFRNAWIARGLDSAGLDCILSRHGILPPSRGCSAGSASHLVGDFDGNGGADVALMSGSGWNTVPVAFATRSGRSSLNSGYPVFAGSSPAARPLFSVTNRAAAFIPAADPRAVKLIGDFNGDGRSDVALAGAPGMTGVLAALSAGDGTFIASPLFVSGFGSSAADPDAVKLTGDFNGDRRADILLTGPRQWNEIRLALSKGSGGLSPVAIATPQARDFADWASDVRTTKLTGDFDGNGRTDVALVGGAGWEAVPVAFSVGTSLQAAFVVTNRPIGDFAAWAATRGAVKLAGDFNRDGRTDIALCGPSGWRSVPIAFSNGDGTFTVTNFTDGEGTVFGSAHAGDFAAWASTPGAAKLTGDFNGDGRTDIALTGPSGWRSVPVAFANGNGSFSVTNAGIGDFGTWASTPGGVQLAADFNGDGRSDIALTGASGWNTMPVAISRGDGSFTVDNSFVGDFGSWSATQ
jgi:hypothetical protein